MQKTNNIIIKAALTVFAAFLATGCIFEKMAMPEDLQSVLIQVKVSAEEMTTKATEAPSAAEEAINSIRIYAFRDGKLSGHYYTDAVVSGQPIVMDLRLPESGTADIDFYVVANEDSMSSTSGTTLSEATSEADLADFSFSSFGAEDGSLPMYGTESVTINVENKSSAKNTADGHKDHYYITDGTEDETPYTVSFDLKRPVAKISFYVATPGGASDGAYLYDVTMPAKGTRTYGYLFENHPDLDNIQPTANGIDFLAEASVPVTGVSSSYDTYMPVFEDVYFFEVPYGSDNWYTPVHTNSVVFNISYSSGDDGTVNMPPIKRNNHYKVYCTLPQGEGSIQVSYVVADWEDTEKWTLEFDYPTYSSPLPPTGNHEASAPYGEAVMYYTGTEEGAFSVDFQMSAPVGQTWTPTFFGNLSDYEIRVYDGATRVTPPITASDKWYTIKVVPLKPENIGHVVQLGVTYMPTWSTEPEFLIINSGNAWTSDGHPNGDLIVVKQIEK